MGIQVEIKVDLRFVCTLVSSFSLYSSSVKTADMSVKLVLNVIVSLHLRFVFDFSKINRKSTKERQVFVLQSLLRLILAKATFILPCSMYI